MFNINNLLNLTCLLILLFKIIEIIINNLYLTINIIIKRINLSQIHVRQVNTNMIHLLNVLGRST